MKTALITGASSGIGYELSKCFAQNRYNVILCARSKEKLTQVAKEIKEKYEIGVTVLAADLSHEHTAQQIHKKVTTKGIRVDVLVNNAGFGTWGKFTSTNMKKEHDMITVNITALTELCKLFAKDMTKRGSGKILNVASMAGFFPGPLMSVYYATKAYVLSFSQSLANECKGTGVSVSCLCPGRTATGFEKAGDAEESKLFKGKLMSAQDVAWVGYHGLMKEKLIIVPGFKNKMNVFFTRIFPRRMQTKIVRRMQEKE